MIKTILKYLGISVVIYSFLCLITPFNKTLRNRSIKNQIQYLSTILDDGYDDVLQARFSEGKLLSNCLLALSTIEYCERNGIANNEYATIVDHCIERIQSERGLMTFDENLQPQYGAFYQGWSNLVYTSYENSSLIRHSAIAKELSKKTQAFDDMIYNIQSDGVRILNSYYDSNWPADNLVCIASVDNDDIRSDWIDQLLETTEHPSGLIHHSGSQKSIVRGSSTALILYLLNLSKCNDIEDYRMKYEEIFIDSYLGIQLVKEYEDGSDQSDFDTGPIVFGYGASGTIMNIKTQANLNSSNAKITWAAMNLISIPINIFNKKYLIFQQEPMLDLFMLWASTDL